MLRAAFKLALRQIEGLMVQGAELAGLRGGLAPTGQPQLVDRGVAALITGEDKDHER
jgi:hypothetical protein